MGEAKMREAAMDAGKPLPHKERCPKVGCRSFRVTICEPTGEMAQRVARLWGNDKACELGLCRACGTIWETWPTESPDDIYRDDVEREPCNNCAYRAGSSESKDRDKWAELVTLAEEAAAMELEPGCKIRWFSCHKGIPIIIDPKASEPIRFGFAEAGRTPMDCTCSGFLRLVAAVRKKDRKKGEA